MNVICVDVSRIKPPDLSKSICILARLARCVKDSIKMEGISQ